MKFSIKVDTAKSEWVIVYIKGVTGYNFPKMINFFFCIQHIQPVLHRRIDILFFQILLLFNIMLNDISFFVFMLKMFMKVFCECLV